MRFLTKIILFHAARKLIGGVNAHVEIQRTRRFQAKALTFGVETTEFDKALAEYLKYNRRENAEIVNQKLKAIAYSALDFTDKADRTQVLHQLGQVATKLTHKTRTGQIKFRKHPARVSNVIVKDDSLAERIVRKRMHAAGKHKQSDAEVNAAVRRLIGARVRAIGYIKSGWLPAIRELTRKVKGLGSVRGIDSTVKLIGRPKGDALVAEPGPKVSGWIESRTGHAIGRFSSRPGQAPAIATAGLTKAWDEETRSMMEYVARKKADGVKPYNVR